jgi:hypothetical protein
MGVVTSISGEVARTAYQPRLQADVALEGSYIDVTADHARTSPAIVLPDGLRDVARRPVPRRVDGSPEIRAQRW